MLNRKKSLCLYLLLVFTFLVFFYYKSSKTNELSRNSSNKKEATVFDLNKKLTSEQTYIECKLSTFLNLNVTICTHDLSIDRFVSAAIWAYGAWEPELLNDLNAEPQALVLDVGANIGQYSLFSAKLGHKVLAVEPFYDNLIRIHKSAVLNKVENSMLVIGNALSNKRHELKKLQAAKNNIGAQSLVYDEEEAAREAKNSKYMVETILFDDLAEYLPKNAKAIMKIDIEGFEPFAFEHAAKLFDHIDIKCIYMEWGTLAYDKKNHWRVIKLMEFLYERNYDAYGEKNKLIRKKWLNWPWDIVWRKNHV